MTLVNFPTWVLNGAFDSGFTMKLMRKDVRLAKPVPVAWVYLTGFATAAKRVREVDRHRLGTAQLERMLALIASGSLDPQVTRTGSWHDPMPLVQALLDRQVDGKAVLDALGGDADRNVVEHRFQKLGGRRQFARQLALLRAILMRADRPAIGQAEELRNHRMPVRQFGDDAFGPAGKLAELEKEGAFSNTIESIKELDLKLQDLEKHKAIDAAVVGDEPHGEDRDVARRQSLFQRGQQTFGGEAARIHLRAGAAGRRSVQHDLGAHARLVAAQPLELLAIEPRQERNAGQQVRGIGHDGCLLWVTQVDMTLVGARNYALGRDLAASLSCRRNHSPANGRNHG